MKARTVLFLLGALLVNSCRSGDKDRVLWNGEDQNQGIGWVSPGKNPNIYVHLQDQQSHSSPYAAQFHFAATKLWVECAWRWFPWLPPTSGTNFEPYQAIRFALKTTTPFPADDLHVRLDSAPRGLKSKMLSLKTYDPAFADGQWHVITIPLDDFREPGMTYEPEHAVELFFGTRLEKGSFDFFLDDITLLKTNTPTSNL